MVGKLIALNKPKKLDTKETFLWAFWFYLGFNSRIC